MFEKRIVPENFHVNLFSPNSQETLLNSNMVRLCERNEAIQYLISISYELPHRVAALLVMAN